MQKRLLKYIFLLATALLLVSFAQPTLALEVNYPNIPGAPLTGPESLGINGLNIFGQNVTLLGYVDYVFTFAVVVAGIIGAISIIISGFSMLVSAGNPTAISFARDRIFGSILGIILLMFAFIILGQINPELINPRTVALPIEPGVYLMGDEAPSPNNPTGKVYKSAPSVVNDTDNLEATYTNLFYNCTPTANNPGRTLFVWTYQQTNLALYDPDGADTIVRKCGDTTPIPIKSPVLSFKQQLEDAGIYFYLKPGCAGIASCAEGSNSDSCAQKVSGFLPDFGSPAYSQYAGGSPMSVRIVSGKDPLSRYGLILSKVYKNNQSDSFNGECTSPILNINPGSVCVDIPLDEIGSEFDPRSVEVINPNPNYLSSGDGVDLYSQYLKVSLSPDLIGPWYTYGYSGNNAGYPYIHTLLPSDDGNPDSLIFGKGQPYNNSTPPDDECSDVDTTCLQSVETTGYYYSIFYGKNRLTGDKNCEIFVDRQPSLNLQNLLNYDKEIYRMDLVPKFPDPHDFEHD